MTRDGAAILGGSWLLALWAHAALPGTLPFALALLLLGVAAGLARRTAIAVAVSGRATGGGSGTPRGAAESAELVGMRAELRTLEAELHVLVDEERAGPRAGSPDAGSNIAKGGAR